MRKRKAAFVALVTAAALVVPIGTASAGTAHPDATSRSARTAAAAGGTGEFVVFYADGVTAADARAAVAAAGGTVVDEIDALGIARVTTDNSGFSKALIASGKAKGVVRNHAVGSNTKGAAHRFAEERALEDRAAYAAKVRAGGAGAAASSSPKKAGPETFSSLQWGMQMIGATPNLAHATATGDGVTVGIIDTGIDSTHPDLAPNFNAALSRNFTTDIPVIDGACEAEPDQSCEDPPTVDEGGHGTHVAGIVAAAANGIGVAGVAPDATLVNLRAGQDSGFFFFFETVDAIAYAGENGIDVVNMSFYTDPWLYNCDSRDDIIEGDISDAELLEQATIREGIIAAVDFARNNGVTLVAAAGNQHTDLAAPTRFDDTSPDFPLNTAKPLTVTSDCLDLPSEAPGVIEAAAIGPSKVKSDFSTWGLGVIDVAAPGGWFRDHFGTNDFMEPENMILSSYPLAVAQEEGGVNKSGGVRDPFYKRDCSAGKPCAYYQYLQGTSMASPHTTGVVALIIEAHGTPDGAGGFDLDPDTVYDILTSRASDTPCPDPALLDYTQEGRPASWNATCVGTADVNSNYGEGIVNAAAAVAP
ncbi:MAG TPA: S8 family serine peptidase [Acidimicrobiales bacterium]|nr:S8 family serine peptidase [Acidimicrobiales bacterium]